MDSPLTQIDQWPVPHAAAAVVGSGNAGSGSAGSGNAGSSDAGSSDAGSSGVLARHGDQDRLFRLASISKVLTGYATLIAVEEGSVKLDDVIESDNAADQTPASTGAPFTLRHLLSHAGGFGFDSSSKQLSAPETRRIYSNEGIERAARIVEANTGMVFAQYLREAVFEPLGMRNSELRGSPAANVLSTVTDLRLFAAELLRPTLLAPETFADFTRCQFPTLAGMLPGIGRFDPLPWGLGVELKGNKTPHWSGQFTSPATFGHFGGSGTFLWVDPTRSLAAIALADREFGAWAMLAWPQLSNDIIANYGD
jgi:CubicO group peptidase (beta-lactamase class C family)